MSLNLWAHDSPFIPGTTIRAEAMNVKLEGIAASFEDIGRVIEGNLVKLPTEFKGRSEIPAQTFVNRILYINADGDMDLYSMAPFDQAVQQTIQNRNTTGEYRDEARRYRDEAAGIASSFETIHWSNVESKPATAIRWPAFSEVTGKPETATRWPSWSEITGKPSDYNPTNHSHTWGQIRDKPATAVRWPSLSEVTGVAGRVGSANVTIERRGAITVEAINTDSNRTVTLNTAAFSVGDVTMIKKCRIDGDLTLTVTTGSIQLPNGQSGHTHILEAGATGQIMLIKSSATLWALTVTGVEV